MNARFDPERQRMSGAAGRVVPTTDNTEQIWWRLTNLLRAGFGVVVPWSLQVGGTVIPTARPATLLNTSCA